MWQNTADQLIMRAREIRRAVAVLVHYRSHGRQKPRHSASGWRCPVDRYRPSGSIQREGAAAVITSFALWGLSQLLLSVVMVLVAVRYRGLIPAVYLLILMEYLGHSHVSANLCQR